MWFDSHCHLHLCEDNSPVADVLERARLAGLVGLLTVGIDLDSSRRSVELTKEEGVYAAVGVHPNSSTSWTPDALRVIEELAGDLNVVAIGETGIDFYRDEAPKDVQVATFRDHIDLAKRLDKAMVVHTRASIEVALDVLDQVGAPERFVFHCWSGDPDSLKRSLAAGAFISFAGNVSFASADDLRDAALKVPHDRLLVETDSPFLAPVPHRGKPNEPRNVAFVGDAVAQALDVDPHELADRTAQNTRALLNIS